jgi:hypothetical protein
VDNAPRVREVERGRGLPQPAQRLVRRRSAALAEALGDRTLRRLFAGLLVAVAAQIAWRARRRG